MTRLRCSCVAPLALALVLGCPGGGDEAGEDTGSSEQTGETDEPGDGEPGDGDGDPGDGLVPVFLAQGKVGRTILSCDDGLSWIHDRSYDVEGSPEMCDMVQAVDCFDGPCSFWDAGAQACEMVDSCDCDHSPGASTGLAFGAGVFVGAWGWGPPGALKYSSDGVSWSVGHAPTTQAGVAFGLGTFIAGNRTPRLSADGVTWVDGGDADFRNEADEIIWNARTLAFADVMGGVFVAGASSGNGSDLMVSVDAGQSWSRPAGSWTCGGGFNGAVGGNGAIVVVFGDKSCVSQDGGQSFELTPLAGGADVEFDGQQFVSWAGDQRWTSVDGSAWEATPLSVVGLPQGHQFQLGRVARSGETGTYVSVRSGWQNWYELQDFYRSVDGVSWDVLAPDQFTGSHPITDVAYGRLASAACD